jgi:DNA-binding NtrC family response regulator
VSNERIVLVVQEPGGSTTRHELTPGITLMVGSDSTCDLVLPGRGVSKRHALFSWGEGGPRIRDLDSAHGTQVDGHARDEARIEPGSEIAIRAYRIRVEATAIAGAPEGRPPTGALEVSRRILEALAALPADSGGEASDLVPTLAALTAAFDAERGILFLPGDDGLRPAQEVSMVADGGPPEPVSRNLLERVAASQEPVLLTSAETEELRSELRSIGGSLRSIVASAIDLPGAPGVVYLESLLERRRFGDADRQLLATFVSLTEDRLRNREAAQQALRRADRLGELGRRALAASEMLGDSAPMARLFEDLGQVAPTPVSVLIQGETGSGKELVARAIHQASDRASGPFVPVNCAAVPADLVESEFFGHVAGAFSGAAKDREGLVQLAEGGTLFLDEFGELPLGLQAKLLRVLEDRKVRRIGGHKEETVDFRLVTATNADILTDVSEGRFREDLYYRACGFPLLIPPLRDRGDDVLLLARRFLEVAAREFRREVSEFSHGAEALLKRCAWPGNVRQLKNVVEQSVIRARGGTIEKALLGPVLGLLPEVPEAGGFRLHDWPTPLSDARREFDRQYIEACLEEGEGNMSRVAEIVGLNRKNLYRRCDELGIDYRSYRTKRGDGEDSG